jgi:tripartite-type tricarboxylate transporter receptor subunit TctC
MGENRQMKMPFFSNVARLSVRIMRQQSKGTLPTRLTFGFKRSGLRALGMLTLAILGANASQTALAQTTYPQQAIKIIVPQPPGGGFDTVARLLAERLSSSLAQSVIVENRTGAGTLVGTEAVAKAAPDGYTLLLGGLSNMALNPGFYPKLSYDPVKDFSVIGLAVTYSYTLVARKDLPMSSLAEVIAYAKGNPDKLNYASAGNGSGQHIGLAVLSNLTGAKMTHVPYRGAQAAYQDLIAGRVDLFFDLSPTAKIQVDADRVKALAVSSKERQAFHPAVPSLTETGVAKLEMESWFGLFAPVAIPAQVLQRLRTEFANVMAQAEVIERFQKTGGRPLRITASEAEGFVKQEAERWTRLVREAGVKAD